jgi:hypothetical protein
VDNARARALLDQERRRLDQLGRAVSRDHDDAVAVSSFSHGTPAGTATIGDVTAFAVASTCKVGATSVVDSGAGERLG